MRFVRGRSTVERVKLRSTGRCAWLVFVGCAFVSGQARAQYGGSAGASTGKKKLAFHDSTFLFDQSATTTTLGIGKGYQSSDPLYE
jgi:hypothetical protein